MGTIKTEDGTEIVYKSPNDPVGLSVSVSVFDDLRAQLAANRSQ